MPDSQANIHDFENPVQPRYIGRVNLIGVKTLTLREIQRFTSVYMQTIVAPVITTGLFYIIFALAFGGLEREVAGMSFLQFLLPGIIMMSMAQSAFVNVSSSLVIAKIQGNIVDMLMPPLSDAELLVGYLSGSLVRGIFVGLVSCIFMALFVDIHIANPGLIVVFSVLGMLMLGAMGMAGGIWADKFDHIAAVTNFAITPLTFLSGTFYSIHDLPETWQAVAHFNPFFYMIDGFRAGFIGHADSNIMTGVGVLCLVNLALIMLIHRMLRTGYKIKS